MTNLPLAITFFAAMAIAYVMRLPKVLKNHSDLPYVLCKAIAAAQAWVAGLIVLFIWRVI